MTNLMEIGSLTALDGIVVAVFITVWLGMSWWIEHPSKAQPSVTVLMGAYRHKWMEQMVTRDSRIFDAQIMGSLRQGTAFFASTCLLAVGGVLALIGNVAPLQGAVAEIAMIESAAVVWQIKLSLVLILLTNGFLKFVWSNRVFGYCSVMMAAVPNDVTDPDVPMLASKAAGLNIRAAMNFNRGLRSMYFALGAVAWLAGPLALLVATVLTGWLVWSREFMSMPREIILRDTGL